MSDSKDACHPPAPASLWQPIQGMSRSPPIRFCSNQSEACPAHLAERRVGRRGVVHVLAELWDDLRVGVAHKAKAVADLRGTRRRRQQDGMRARTGSGLDFAFSPLCRFCKQR